MKGAGADLHVQGLDQHAAVFHPVSLQGQDQFLKGPGLVIHALFRYDALAWKNC